MHLHFLITRKDGLSRKEFSDHWRNMSMLPWLSKFPAFAAMSKTTPRLLSVKTRPTTALSKSGWTTRRRSKRLLTARSIARARMLMSPTLSTSNRSPVSAPTTR